MFSYSYIADVPSNVTILSSKEAYWMNKVYFLDQDFPATPKLFNRAYWVY